MILATFGCRQHGRLCKLRGWCVTIGRQLQVKMGGWLVDWPWMYRKYRESELSDDPCDGGFLRALQAQQ